MKKLLYVVLCMVAIPCYAHQDQNTVDLENLDLNNWLQNCRTNVNTYDNSIEDIINTQSPFANFRECLQQNISKVHNKICTSRNELKEQRQSANSAAERGQIEGSLDHLDEIQFNFNETLYRQAIKFIDTNNWLVQQEVEALRDILTIHESSCL